jgi:hypothetical protein
MGAHGGAIARGQIEGLQVRGINKEAVQAPIRTTLDVVGKGELDGLPFSFYDLIII